jgi:hypothetical protein
MKNYVVRFYGGAFSEDNAARVSTILQSAYDSFQQGNPYPHLQDGSVAYELRDLHSLNGGTAFKGVLAVLRDDAPHIRAADGLERPIALGENEHVIEKNHFLFFKENELLVWQANGRASHISRLEAYLSALSGTTIVLNDVISQNALQRLEEGTVRRFKVRLGKVRNAEAVDPHNWEAPTFDLMNGVDGTSMMFEVATRRKQKGLTDSIKQAVHRFLDRPETKAIEVKLLGEQDPIDLFADCVKDRISVGMVGLYPVPDEIFAALAAAKDRQQGALDAYFGTGDAVLE